MRSISNTEMHRSRKSTEMKRREIGLNSGAFGDTEMTQSIFGAIYGAKRGTEMGRGGKKWEERVKRK